MSEHRTPPNGSGGAVLAYAHLPPSDLDADDGAATREISMAFEAPKLE
jgi:hypothetical protein